MRGNIVGLLVGLCMYSAAQSAEPADHLPGRGDDDPALFQSGPDRGLRTALVGFIIVMIYEETHSS